jgi:hypothetical protein
MTKIKTSELTGAALDWAVSEADDDEADLLDGRLVIYRADSDGGNTVYSPSTNWAQGGPISERELIYCGPCNPMEGSVAAVMIGGTKGWSACYSNISHQEAPTMYGPTELVAKMRCYVARKLGAEVDVPEELLK